MREPDEDPGRMALTWLGHGTVVAHGQSATVVIDPLLRDRLLFLRRYAPLGPAAQPTGQAVLLTHAHHDHLDIPSLRRLGRRVPKYAPSGADRVLVQHELGPVYRVTAGDMFEVGDIAVEVVPAIHSGGRFRRRAGDEAVGYVLARSALRVYVAGDTGLFEGMVDIGPVDVAVLPVGGWWSALGASHLNSAGAVAAANLLGARVLVPIHLSTFHPRYPSQSMLSSWAETSRVLTEQLRRYAPDVELRMLQPGETATFSTGPVPRGGPGPASVS